MVLFGIPQNDVAYIRRKTFVRILYFKHQDFMQFSPSSCEAFELSVATKAKPVALFESVAIQEKKILEKERKKKAYWRVATLHKSALHSRSPTYTLGRNDIIFLYVL